MALHHGLKLTFTMAEAGTEELVAASRQSKEKEDVLTILLIESGPPESFLGPVHWALAGTAET